MFYDNILIIICAKTLNKSDFETERIVFLVFSKQVYPN